MKYKDGMRLHGAMTVTLKKPNGDVTTFWKDNLVVDVGFDFVANAIGAVGGARPAVMSHIAVGTGTTAAVAADSALVTELNRQPATYAHTAGTKLFSFTADFDAGVATGPLTEAGVINAGVDGILFDRVVFPVINKGVDDQVTVIFTFTMA